MGHKTAAAGVSFNLTGPKRGYGGYGWLQSSPQN